VNPKVGKVSDNVRLRREVMKELNLVQKTKRRAREKTGKSECKFRLIIRLGNTCQVSTSYILLEIPCSIRGSDVSRVVRGMTGEGEWSV